MQGSDRDVSGVWGQQLKRIADLRDAILALGALLYLLGYASWGIYAWQHGLGLLPPLEGQYFVSGLIPALLIAMCAAAFRLLLWIRQKLSQPADELRKRRSRILLSISVILIVVAWVLAYLWPETQVLGWVAFSAFLVGFAGVIYGFDVSSRFDRITGWFSYWYAVVVLPYLVAVGFWIYVDSFFPGLPTELGGPLAQCVRLDVITNRLSQETLEKLGVPRGNSQSASRTRELYLLYRGGGFVIVSPNPEGGTALFRVSEEIISAVGRCQCSGTWSHSKIGVMEPPHDRGFGATLCSNP